MTPAKIDLTARPGRVRDPKLRRRDVFRVVPVSPDYLDTLDMVHGVRELATRPKSDPGLNNGYVNDLLVPPLCNNFLSG